MVLRGCAPKRLCITSNRGCESEDKALDITEALLFTLACFSGPQLQLSELWIHGPCKLTPAVASALAATSPRLAALGLIGHSAEATARGPADGLVGLLRQLPFLERLTLSESAYRSFDCRTVLSASVCRALRGGADTSEVALIKRPSPGDVAGGGDCIHLQGAVPRPARAPCVDFQAIRHLELSFMDPIAVLTSLEGCSQLQSLNVISPLRRRNRSETATTGVGNVTGTPHPREDAALRGLRSLKGLRSLILGEFGGGTRGGSYLPLLPTLASLPSLRSLLLPMWRVGPADLQALSLLTSLEQLVLSTIMPYSEESPADDASAAGTTAGPSSVLKRYLLPPRLRNLTLLRPMSVRKLYMLQPTSDGGAGNGTTGDAAMKDAPRLGLWLQHGSIRFGSSHVSSEDLDSLKTEAVAWFSGAVQLLRLRCASRPRWPSTGPGDSLAFVSTSTAAAAAPWPCVSPHEPPPNQRLIVEGPTGRYLKGPLEPAPMTAPATTVADGTTAASKEAESKAPAVLSGNNHQSWLRAMAPLNLLSLELRWMALSTCDLDMLASSLPSLKTLGLERCVYPVSSLPRLAALPSLELLLLESIWWPVGSEAEAALALLELCRSAANLRRVGLPCRRWDDHRVPLVAWAARPRAAGTATNAVGGGAGGSTVAPGVEAFDQPPCIYGTASASESRARVAAGAAAAAWAAMMAEGIDPGKLRTDVSSLWG